MANKIEFSPPKGFVIPEGIQPGHDFDMVCTFRATPGGKICMVQLGDQKLDGYSERTAAPDYKDLTKSMTEGMGEQ